MLVKVQLNNTCKQHNKEIHYNTINDNLEIIGSKIDRKDLHILESLLIKQRKPFINVQINNFETILKIFK